jgi:molecular chaperone GrpE|tara:strand:+ start:2497 stop:3072 length:576 start_codon:yes stop_codon:yes gene_type:complete
MAENSEKKITQNLDETVEKEILEVKELSIEDKLKETEEKLLRSLAETENQRRRFEKEIKDAFDFGGFNFAKETLSILDNVQRAKISITNDDTFKENKDLSKFIKNIDILEKDLISIFEKNKIKKIETIKQKFDPNFHQAMLEIEDDNYEPGTIVQEIQPGYLYGERLLRPSFVGVSKKIDDKNEEKNQKLK